MKIYVKRSLCLVFVLIMMMSSLFCVSAAEVATDNNDGVMITAVGGSDAEPLADTIVWKYKTVDGVLYKRRWNETQQKWYDSAWIKVG